MPNISEPYNVNNDMSRDKVRLFPIKE